MTRRPPCRFLCGAQLRKAVATQLNGAAGEIDILIWMGRAALELIGQGGLGYSFDPLEVDMTDTYGHALKTLQYVYFSLRPTLSRQLIQ